MHTMPAHDAIDHEPTVHCICGPMIRPRDGDVPDDVIHYALDPNSKEKNEPLASKERKPKERT
jgi:hypothetical protein